MRRARARAQQALSALLQRQGNELVGLTTTEARAALRLYRQARLELLDALTQLPRGQLQAQTYRSAMAQIEAGIRHLSRRLGMQLSETMPHRAGALAGKHLNEIILRYASRFPSALRPIQTPVATTLATGKSLLLPRFETSVARYGMKLIGDMQRRVATSLLAGEKTEDTVARLFVDYLAPLKTVEVAGGRVPVTAKWAERIIRTESVEAYSTMMQLHLRETAQHEPRVQKMWVTSGEKNVCDVCDELDGEIRELDDVYEAANGRVVSGPVAHPNCNCQLIPWMPEWAGEHL